MESKCRPLSADNASQHYQEIKIITNLNESNSILGNIENKLDQRFNELNNNFNEKIALLLKALVNMLMNRGLIKETYFEKVKSIFDKINRGEKIAEEDKRILRESRK